MDFTYISNNKTAGKDIRYNIPGHFSFATFYTYAFSIYMCIYIIYTTVYMFYATSSRNSLI